ncbi:MAG TPA: hypothetical protein VH374_00735 [Polyangia bacterium]|nr:hypothetical protein [Polyangia bacterium]
MAVALAVMAAVAACAARPETRAQPNPAPAMASNPAVAVAAAKPPAPDDTGMPAAKRIGPPDVPSVRVGELVVAVLPWGKARGLGQNGGYLTASDATTGKEQWVQKVYEVAYDPKMEEDVQDVFIESLIAGPAPSEVTVSDERGGIYRVDLTTHLVRTVKPRPTER